MIIVCGVAATYIPGTRIVRVKQENIYLVVFCVCRRSYQVFTMVPHITTAAVQLCRTGTMILLL